MSDVVEPCRHAITAGDGWLFCKLKTRFHGTAECAHCESYKVAVAEEQPLEKLIAVCQAFVASYRGERDSKSLKQIYEDAVEALRHTAASTNGVSNTDN